MDTALLLEWTIKSVILVLVMTGGFAYLTLFERRVLARLQVRIGPNRAGPFGLLQPIADAIKLVFKEELIPAGANKFIFVLAPIITVFPALVITAVIPWGETVVLFGKPISLHLADISAETKRMTTLGQGVIDWKKLFAAAKKAGVKNYFVEMQLELLKASIPYLKSLKV